VNQLNAMKWARATVIAVSLVGSMSGHAALFEDDDARKAILDLRQRVDAQKAAGEVVERRQTYDINQLRRSLLDLQNQIEVLRAEQARMRGQSEQFTRDLAEAQRRQATSGQALDDRLRSVEPQKVDVDGKEFVAGPGEKRDFDAAMAVFRSGDFSGAQVAFLDFAKRYPKSGFHTSVLFWLGNAQYATRNYKEAITNFRSMLAQAPDHPRAAEAMLAIANCQIELKDTRTARRTLEDVIRLYPQTEAAQAAKERLTKIR
jgi:tol-pal system protein YbgF